MLPEVSTSGKLNKVQIYCKSLGVSDGYYWGIENTKESDPCKGWSLMDITHWKKLPDPPK